MVVETMIRELRQEMRKEMHDLRKLIMGRGVIGNWVPQSVACAMMGIQRRRLYDIRVHVDKTGRKIGEIRWRKSKGRKIEYYKPDIERWLADVNVQ